MVQNGYESGRRSTPVGFARAALRAEGQNLVEFAIVLPLLLAIFVGIIEFGNAWRTSQTVTNAAREGARFAAVASSSTTTDAIIARVKERLAAAGVDSSSATVTVTGDCTVGCTGDPVMVSVDLPFQFYLVGPVVGLIWGQSGSGPSTVTLSSTTTMRNE